MPLIQIGDLAPDFALTDQSGVVRRRSDYTGAPLVIYFYPKDDTKGCTDEACQFRDALPRFRKADVAVLGISPDDHASHAAFAAKHKLSFPILSNPTQEVLEAYGVWRTKSMFGRPYMGVIRTTYLLNGEGAVVRRWDNVSVPGHADEVFEEVRDLLGALAPTVEAKPRRKPVTTTKKSPRRKP